MTTKIQIEKVFNQLQTTTTCKIPRWASLGSLGDEPGMEGNIVLDKSTQLLCFHNGTTWVCLGGPSPCNCTLQEVLGNGNISGANNIILNAAENSSITSPAGQPVHVKTGDAGIGTDAAPLFLQPGAGRVGTGVIPAGAGGSLVVATGSAGVDGGAGGNDGGDVNMTTGNGSALGRGGNFVLTGGSGGISGDGGSFLLTTGPAPLGGTGGAFTVNTGAGTGSGTITLQTGDSNLAGSINIIGGNSNGLFGGGNISINSGTNAGAGPNGIILVSAGATGPASNTFQFDDSGISGETRVRVPVGAVGTPSICFQGDTNTGIFHPAADTIALTCAGASEMSVDSSSITIPTNQILVDDGTTTAPSYSFISGSDSGISYNPAGVLQFSTGGFQIAEFDGAGPVKTLNVFGGVDQAAIIVGSSISTNAFLTLNSTAATSKTLSFADGGTPQWNIAHLGGTNNLTITNPGTAGSFDVASSLGAVNAIRLQAPTPGAGVTISAHTSIDIDTTVAGTIDIDTGTGGFLVDATGGQCRLHSTSNNANAIQLLADGGTSATIDVSTTGSMDFTYGAAGTMEFDSSGTIVCTFGTTTSPDVTVNNGDLVLGSLNRRLVAQESGVMGSVGQVTLSSGTATITTTLSATSRIFLTVAAHGGTAGNGYAVNNASGVVTAIDAAGTTVATDTSTLNYFVVNN